MKSIAFGLERLALPAVNRPWIVAGFLALVFAIVGYGLTKPRFDDNLRDVFGGSAEVVTAYVEATEQFIDPENQFVLLVEGNMFDKPGAFDRLGELQFELQFIDGVSDVFSLFALRSQPQQSADGALLDAPLVIDDTVTALTPEVIDRVRSHPFLGEKLVSEDGTAMLFVLTPEQAGASLSDLRVIDAAIASVAEETLKGSGLTFTRTGFPALRINIVDVLVRDTVFLNTTGAALGFVLNLIIFGSLTAACMIAFPSILSSLVVVGFMGAFGVPISVLSNAVPVLVMILAFANSMHLCRAWRLSRDAGMTSADAARYAIVTVGPACILAALTTAVAFFSLVFSDVSIVSNFGLIGAIGCMVGAFVVLLMHGLMAITVGRFWKRRARSATFIDWLSKPSVLAGTIAADYARPICILALFAVVVFGALYANVQPEYSVREHLAKDNPANAGLGRIDEKLGGSFPVYVIVPLEDPNPTAPANLEKIGTVHRTIATVEGATRPMSLWSLVEWLGDTNAPDSTRLDRILEEVSPDGRRRFIGANGAALISMNIPDAPVAVVETLISQLEESVKAAAGDDVVVTGVTVITARQATETIGNLNANLVGAILSGLMVILIAFRSWRIAVTSVIPNILPLLTTGALIFVIGDGIHFSNILALTIAFGIAVDGTIHYFNYFFHYSEDSKSLRENLIETSRRIGPQLYGMTAVIVVGLITTQFSQLPNIVVFGRLVAFTLMIGLVGDLVVLPALMAGAARRWFTGHRMMQPIARGAA